MGRSNKAQANGLGEESLPRNLPALKGRDEPFELAEATFRGGQGLVISPLQGLLPKNDGVSFATQAWALLARPFRARSRRAAPQVKSGQNAQASLAIIAERGELGVARGAEL
jgi:hypothetical protein